MRKDIPNPRPAIRPLNTDGFFIERNIKSKKKAVKKRLLVWDIIVEDINRNQTETAPKIEAKSPTL